MGTDVLSKQQKRALIDSAWAEYRAASTAIPRTLPFAGYKRAGVFREGFLEADDRLWKKYLVTERVIAAAPEAKAA
jgi:hypothetical protein